MKVNRLDGMEAIIKEVVSCQKKLIQLEEQLKDRAFWIKKAQEEAGFIPEEGDWVHVEIGRYKIQVSVYHKNRDIGTSRYWINGQWFNTNFPDKIPYLF